MALSRARQAGADVRCLLTTYSGKTGRTVGHGFPLDLVQAQAGALGLELVAVDTEWAEYEARFKQAICCLRDKGMEAGVFGDIALAEHRQWVERVAREAGVSAWLPLWGEEESALLQEWLSAGFKGIVVAVRVDALGLGWLGRHLDSRCIEELAGALCRHGHSPCGEKGEYHTLVVDGPPFRKRLRVEEAVPVLRGEHWVLDIQRFSLSAGCSCCS